MNIVMLTGRLTKDPELRYTVGSGTAVCTFTLAVDRGKNKDGQNEADFIRCRCWDKDAENLERFKKKGDQIAIMGSIKTGSYEGDHGTVYTTDINCNRIEYLGSNTGNRPVEKEVIQDTGFAQVEEQIPF